MNTLMDLRGHSLSASIAKSFMKLIHHEDLSVAIKLKQFEAMGHWELHQVAIPNQFLGVETITQISIDNLARLPALL